MAMLDVVNDRSSMILRVAFFDEDDVAMTPDSATCRIDDVTSGTSVRAKTALTGVTTTCDILITSAENAPIGTRESEERIVTVEWLYASSARRGTDEYRYVLKNLTGVTT